MNNTNNVLFNVDTKTLKNTNTNAATAWNSLLPCFNNISATVLKSIYLWNTAISQNMTVLHLLKKLQNAASQTF